MSQVRRQSLDSKLKSQKTDRKESDSESVRDRKLLDKGISTAKSIKATGAMRQTSIKEQLKPRANTIKKCSHEDNNSTPPKKRVNCETLTMPVETSGKSSEVKSKELNPEHEELKQQIFPGIRLMLDPIKDIEQIKLDQRGLESEAINLSGHKLKQQIVKNEEKQKKLEHIISALEAQQCEKNIIFQGLEEDEFDDIKDTKSQGISVLATITSD